MCFSCVHGSEPSYSVMRLLFSWSMSLASCLSRANGVWRGCWIDIFGKLVQKWFPRYFDLLHELLQCWLQAKGRQLVESRLECVV